MYISSSLISYWKIHWLWLTIIGSSNLYSVIPLSYAECSDALDDLCRAVLRWLFTIRLLLNFRRCFFKVSSVKSHRSTDPHHSINNTYIRWTYFHFGAFM